MSTRTTTQAASSEKGSVTDGRRIACALARMARMSKQHNLRRMADKADAKLSRYRGRYSLDQVVATRSDPLPGMGHSAGSAPTPGRIPMSDPRIVRVNVTNRLRWALAAASAGDWRKAEDHTRQALAELAIDWQDQPARVDRAA